MCQSYKSHRLSCLRVLRKPGNASQDLQNPEFPLLTSSYIVLSKVGPVARDPVHDGEPGGGAQQVCALKGDEPFRSRTPLLPPAGYYGPVP
jgi:hypothetical protein